MFNFYVTLAGHDKIIAVGRVLKGRRKFKAPWMQTNVQKMKDLSKAWVLTGKQFEDFRRKKRTETKFLTFQKHTAEHTTPKYHKVFWQLLCKL